MGTRRQFQVIAAAAALAGFLAVPAGARQTASAAIAHARPKSLSASYRIPPTPKQPAHLGHMLTGPGSGGAALWRRTAMGSAAVRAAAAKAAATGRPVTIAAMTTPTTTVQADPRGGFTLTESVLPTRIRRGSTWVPISASLRRTSGGWLSPVATPMSLRVSDGGTGPLAMMSGRQWVAGLSWPARLPVPVVSGATADYRNVLPGVDLLVTAQQDGGFSETLVIRSARAARNPALFAMVWPVTVRGARLAPGPHGTLVGVRGRAVAFTVSNPMMWDSASRLVTAGTALPGPIASSASRPGVFAHVAHAGQVLTAGGQSVLITPARSLLYSAKTVFPVYIDPTWHSANNNDLDFTFFQQYNCDNSGNYNNSNDKELNVGYYPSNFPGANGVCYGTQRTYYEFGLPNTIDGAVINSATVDARETYSASCTLSAAVDIHQTNGISANNNTWGNQPSWDKTSGHLVDVSDNDGDTTTDNNDGVPATVDADSDGGSTDSADPDAPCGGVDFNGTLSVPYGFTVTDAVSDGVDSSPPSRNVTFVLTEDNQDSTGDSLKDFSNNPSLQIQYDHTPNTPKDLKVGDNPNNLQSCSGTPHVGASSGGVTLSASFSDPDPDALNVSFRYWIPALGQNSGSNKALTSTAGASKTGAPGSVTLSRTVYSGLSPGTPVYFQAQGTDPSNLSSAWSGTCVFDAYPKAAPGPTITPNFTGNPAMGSNVSFKVSPPSSGCTANAFYWSLDQAPPAGGGTKVSTNNAAVNVSIIVPSPGNHEFYAYATCSDNPNGSDTSSSPFTASGDATVSCPSFAAALANQCSITNENFDNTMLSGGSGSCGATAGDGSGAQLDNAQVKAQGWTPGGNVTVDGARFTLPAFGNCATDNILAANQTITMGGQGSALVFLVSSTNATTAVPTGGTGGPNASLVNSVLTAPPVPAGIAVTGSGCSGLTAFDGTASGCSPAQGKITYSDGSTAPFWLTVPDWVAGPPDIAALSVLDRDYASGGQKADYPKIFAFAVPLDPSKQITSVTLPDVGDTVAVTGLTNPLAGLHVFGIAVRNTTTATPVQPGAACLPGCSTPSGQGWTAAFESPIETGWGPTSVNSVTYRMAVAPNLAVASGTPVRIRLSDPGFLSGDTDGPIMIGHATIAPQTPGGPGASQMPKQLTFGGSPCVVIPAGGDIYSDPTGLNFALSTSQGLLVSLYVANGSGQSCGSQGPLPAFSFIPGMANPPGTTQWSTPGDHAGDQSGSAFPGSSWTWATALLTSVDVTTTAAALQGVASPGAPTVVVAGDNLTDSFGSNSKIAPDLGPPSFHIAGQLATTVPAGQTAPTGAGFGVVDAGIEANQVQADGSPTGGVSLLARLDHDVLAEPDVGTVIVSEGLEDLLKGASSDAITSGYGQLYNILAGFGITTVFATLTPCAGYAGTGSPADACTAGGTADLARTDVVNTWIGNNALPPIIAPFLLEADFNAQVATSCASPNQLFQCLGSTSGGTSYDAGDHVNLSSAGYYQAVLAITEPSTAGDLQPPQPPQPPPTQKP